MDKRDILNIFLIIILGLFVYKGSLNGEFIMDDYSLIKNNVQIKSFSNAGDIFLRPLGGGDRNLVSGITLYFYRPLQTLIYLLNYSIFKLNTGSFHFINVLFHILSAISIYWLISILFSQRLLSLFTSLIFMLHPIQTEAVDYISGLADPLALFFIALAFIFYIKPCKYSNIVLSAAYILALLSKENSLIFIPLLLLYHCTFKVKIRGMDLWILLITTFIYFLLRVIVLKQTLLVIINSSFTLFQKLPVFFAAVTTYIRLLLFPFNLHMDYEKTTLKFYDYNVLIGLLLVVFLIVYAFKKRDKNRLIFFSISWFFITLIPVSGIFYPTLLPIAEHYLYMPSVGFCLILAYKINSLNKAALSIFQSRKAPIIFVICLLIFYSNLTIKQHNVWKAQLNFYSNILRNNPNSVIAYNNIGVTQSNNLYTNKDAVSFFKKAIEINPDSISSYVNLAYVYNKMGEKESAIKLYETVIAKNPNWTDAHCLLADIYAGEKNYDKAIFFYEKAIEINAASAKAYFGLATVYEAVGDVRKTSELYERAIRVNPNFMEAYVNLSNLFITSGRNKEAIVLCREAIKRDINSPLAHNNLAVAYFNEREYKLAVKHCDIAVRLGCSVKQEFLELLMPLREK